MKLLLDVLQRRLKFDRTPIWFMRQAGRYLPEYHHIRKKYRNFLDFTRTAEDAACVTLQPLKRFDLDAAIIFSDILVVPAALGQKVKFEVGEGPQLEPWTFESPLIFDKFKETLQPTLDALSIVKSTIDPAKTLIGFSGAPWTLACYMITGHGSKDYFPTIQAAYHQEILFRNLMDSLVTAIVDFISWQIDAGADAIQIFDSWASLCPEPLFDQYVINPIKRIITQVKLLHPTVPVIIFAKGVGYRLDKIFSLPYVNAISIDQMQPLIPELKRDNIVIQGGLDPFLMNAGGSLLTCEIKRYLNFFKNHPYVFNLGHGIYKTTPIKHVEHTIKIIREWDKAHA